MCQYIQQIHHVHMRVRNGAPTKKWERDPQWVALFRRRVSYFLLI
jgi:hypothetical protein